LHSHTRKQTDTRTQQQQQVHKLSPSNKTFSFQTLSICTTFFFRANFFPTFPQFFLYFALTFSLLFLHFALICATLLTKISGNYLLAQICFLSLALLFSFGYCLASAIVCRSSS